MRSGMSNPKHVRHTRWHVTPGLHSDECAAQLIAKVALANVRTKRHSVPSASPLGPHIHWRSCPQLTCMNWPFGGTRHPIPTKRQIISYANIANLQMCLGGGEFFPAHNTSSICPHGRDC